MKETIEELKNFGIDNPIRFNAIKDEKIDVWVVVNLIQQFLKKPRPYNQHLDGYEDILDIRKSW